jgi:nitroimidazol reductase NimA-like FMN-containing flavoprotein (pyridoxamine 5'-phosphate oxidase superfamily)
VRETRRQISLRPDDVVCHRAETLDVDTELVELNREECLRLLGATRHGRVAVNASGWPPVIRPVSYVFDESTHSVVFRTARGSKLTALLLAKEAAFEIDAVEPGGGTGWSVIVLGVAEEVANAAEVERLERLELAPLAPGEKPHWIRLRAIVVSGRRIVCGFPAAPLSAGTDGARPPSADDR